MEKLNVNLNFSKKIFDYSQKDYFKKFKWLKKYLLKRKNIFSKNQRIVIYNFINTNLDTFKFFNLRIRIVPNNVFCYLMNHSFTTILAFGTAGMYNINVSKRNIKFLLFSILKKFIKKCNKFLKKNYAHLVITIKSSKRFKKVVLRLLKSLLKYRKNYIFTTIKSKCFNGCKARKSIKKKRRFFRLYKNI